MESLSQGLDAMLTPSKAATQGPAQPKKVNFDTLTEWCYSQGPLKGSTTDKNMPRSTYKDRMDKARDVVKAIAYRYDVTYYELLGHLIMHEGYVTGRMFYL